MNSRRVVTIFALLILLFSGVLMQNLKTHQQAVASASVADNAVHARGVWHRPNVSGKETTLQGLCEVLDTFADAGINMVFLETFYHGMTVFKTNRVQYYKGFEQFQYGDYPDYLTAFASEAEKRGIEVHAWVQDFYIGVSDENNFVRYYPDWLLTAQNGSYRQTEGKESGGYIFLDPANAEVRQFLVDFYDELLTKVPQVKGLNLDYIRYPVSSVGDDTGFTATAMQQFSSRYGLNLPQNCTINQFISLLNSNNLQNDWTKFRAEIVTGFVQQVFDMVNEKHPTAMLSTAIFPDFQVTYNTKKQDISTWLENDFIDIVTPMVYYYEASQVQSAVSDMMEKCKNCFCYTGLYATYHNQSQEELLAQINASDVAGADGFVLFDSAKTFFQNDYSDVLQSNFGSVHSTLPHCVTDFTVKTVLTELTQRFSALAEEGKENADKVKLFQKEAEAICGGQSADEIKGALNLLVEYNLTQYVSANNAQAALQILRPLQRCVEVRCGRDAVKGVETFYTSTSDDGNETPPSGGNSQTPPDNPPSDDGNDILPLVGIALCILVVGVAAGFVLAKALKKRGKQ